MANCFEHIRNMNNLQLCHFFRMMQAHLPLVYRAIELAENPEIYCSADNWAIGTPKKDREKYETTVYWFYNLRHDYDEEMDEINRGEYNEYARKGVMFNPDEDPGETLGTQWKCSQCGMCFGETHKWHPKDCWNYCPNCGGYIAKEDKEE